MVLWISGWRKVRPGEFRWCGFLLPEEYDEQGRLLYQIFDPMVTNEPVSERPARDCRVGEL